MRTSDTTVHEEKCTSSVAAAAHTTDQWFQAIYRQFVHIAQSGRPKYTSVLYLLKGEK